MKSFNKAPILDSQTYMDTIYSIEILKKLITLGWWEEASSLWPQLKDIMIYRCRTLNLCFGRAVIYFYIKKHNSCTKI